MTLFFFFFNDTATTEIYTLSLHDALPISRLRHRGEQRRPRGARGVRTTRRGARPCLRGRAAAQRARRFARVDRKSTRLNSSHANISYAVFCLKKNNRHSHINPAYLLHSTT